MSTTLVSEIDVHKGSPCSRIGTQRYPRARIHTQGNPTCMTDDELNMKC